MVQLLTTKLIRPQNRTHTVVIPELFKRLRDGVRKSVTIVTAATGMGKTTLLSDFVEK